MRGSEKAGIPFDFSRRLQDNTGTEYANDLQDVYAVTLLRLNSMPLPK